MGGGVWRGQALLFSGRAANFRTLHGIVGDGVAPSTRVTWRLRVLLSEVVGVDRKPKERGQSD